MSKSMSRDFDLAFDKMVVGKLDRLKQSLNRQGQTLGLAESCTGGLLSSWISSQAGASSYFKGAVVSYSGEVKNQVLGLPQHILECMGEVSLPVAQRMAMGTRQLLKVDWALSITGIAGPTGGTKEKPVGFVCFGLCGPGVDKKEQKYFDQKGDDKETKLGRREIQFQSALYALDLLLTTL